MITSTSLKSSTFMPKVVEGCDRALNNAYLNGTDIGLASVLNAKGKLALIAVYRTGYGMEFLDAEDNDVTEVVVSALREYHGYKVFH
jgi:hypothetical protein